MQHLKLQDGQRLADAVQALTRCVARQSQADCTGPAVLAASGPVMSVRKAGSSETVDIVLAPGLYVVSGRLLDTRQWPESARTLPVPPISTGTLPTRLWLSATWHPRIWPADGPAFDPAAPPASGAAPDGLPLDKVACLSEEPRLRLALGSGPVRDQVLCIGQIALTDAGALSADAALLPFVTEMGRSPDVKRAVSAWLQPVFARIDAIDAVRARTALSEAIAFDVAQASLWAEATRQSLALAGAVDTPTVLLAIRDSLSRLMAKIGADTLPAIATGDDAFDLRSWLPLAAIETALATLSKRVDAELSPAAGLVLPADRVHAVWADGKLTLRAELGNSLCSVLGLAGTAAALRLTVEPARPDMSLVGTGTALLHPFAPANRLPAALGQIPVDATASGGLSLQVPLTGAGLEAEIADVLSADVVRLVMAAYPDGDVDHDALPLTLTLNPSP